MNQLDKNYWESRYHIGETGWDIGYAAPALKEYFDGLKDTSIKILIPGSGNGYEAEYLHKKGFSNVYVLDIAKKALEQFQEREPEFPEENLICEDYFDHHGKYDLIAEQTFFCSLDRRLRAEYARKTAELLNPCGKLIGVLFNHEFGKMSPPFGGTKEEYLKYFEPYFEMQVMDLCYNSIKPRAGRELFIKLVKK